LTCLKFGFPAPGRFEDTDRSEIDQLAGYFHYFGVKGHFLMQLGRSEEARIAFDRAIALAHTPAEAAHIRMHLDRLSKQSGPA